MLERDTTFIIGAGASFDLGFPLGTTLRDRIIELLAVSDPNSVNFDDTNLTRIMHERALQEAGTSAWPGQMERYLKAAALIRQGLPFARSIDTFIDGLRHAELVEFMGKLAIAAVILRAEAGSPLVQKPVHAANAASIQAERFKRLIGSWHTELSQILYDGHSVDTLDQVFEYVSFIVFNYDRCLEEFLTLSLMRRFAIDRRRALGLVGRCSIIHPYGQVGAFLPEEEGFVPFGVFEDNQIAGAATRIRTFTETMESATGDRIKDLVAQANVLVFMGFGWLPQNMELLQIEQRMPNVQRVFATTMAMAAGEIEVVARRILETIRRDDIVYDSVGPPLPEPEFISELGDCKALMSNCWLRLTSS